MKKIQLFSLIIIMSFIGALNVNAASATIKTNKTKVEVGDSLMIWIKTY